MEKRAFDVIIVGGGVTGTALAYRLCRNTNVRRILILEKNSWVAQVNSNPMNNAQTSHDGGTETNYTLEHALEVQAAARMLRAYIDAKADPILSRKTKRMVLAVGAEEVETLHKRFREFAPYYPDLSLATADELVKIEPLLMQGRDPKEPVAAIVSTEGYAVNYQRLAECFLEDAKSLNPGLEIRFNVRVEDVRRTDDGQYEVVTSTGTYTTRTIEFASGSYSLFFAQKLGYGLDYAILSVAGSFYSGGPLLKSKVYRVQIPGMPFAAIHGDPDILNPDDTRFGPTTKPLPLMERHRYDTMIDWSRLGLFSWRGLLSLIKIILAKHLSGYVIKNALYDLPVIGKFLFLRAARPIVPTIRYKDLKLRRGAGGIRPQVVDLRTGELIMGDVTILGENCIFNTTPSPGASVCLANATRDAKRIVGFLGGEFVYDENPHVARAKAVELM